MRILRASNPHLKLSFCNIYFAQCVYYALNLLTVIGYIVVQEKNPSSKIRTVCRFFAPIFDLCGQSLVCYICWTQGSSRKQKQFTCTLVPDRNGGMRLQFTKIESVLESKLRVKGTNEDNAPADAASVSEPYEMDYNSFLARQERSASQPSHLDVDDILEHFIVVDTDEFQFNLNREAQSDSETRTTGELQGETVQSGLL